MAQNNEETDVDFGYYENKENSYIIDRDKLFITIIIILFYSIIAGLLFFALR